MPYQQPCLPFMICVKLWIRRWKLQLFILSKKSRNNPKPKLVMKSEIKKGKVHAINISHEKGTIKEAVDNCKVSNYGLLGDAHAGPWHRQVSLLSKESINKFSKKSGRPIAPGEFAENITLSGIDLTNVRV